MTKNFNFQNYLQAHNKLFSKLDSNEFHSAINLIVTKMELGKKIITCGNGGSASTASHYITDWNKMVNLHTGKKFRGFSLVDNIGLITAYGNDLSFEDIFVGQLKAIIDEGDLLIAISGSGNSKNVVNAVKYANESGASTLGILGYDGGALKPLCQQNILVPSFDMQLCEDIHLMFGHMVMKTLCGLSIK